MSIIAAGDLVPAEPEPWPPPAVGIVLKRMRGLYEAVRALLCTLVGFEVALAAASGWMYAAYRAPHLDYAASFVSADLAVVVVSAAQL